MDFRDHQSITIENLKGMWTRYQDPCPIDHVTVAHNVESFQGGYQSRSSINSAYTTLATTGASISQFEEFVRSTGTNRQIVFDENTRKLYDTGSATPTVAIDTAPVGTTGFSLISLYDRAYIAYHNYATGIASSNLKVYYEYPAGSGTWIFRDALGSAPVVGAFAAANSVTAGVISAGTHLFKVAYETNTGFITPASTAISYVATGGFACDLTGIPVGPANTVARHILVTKAITTYSGNPQEYEFFFLTRIADNTTTALSTGFPPVINFYDSQLTSSADYLYDLISSVKSPMGMCMYNGRVVYWGFPQVSYTAPDGTTVNLDYGTFFVSNINDPETISLAENINKIAAADGGSRSIFTCAEYHGSLYLFKRGKTYATRDDGTNVPSAWPIELVDAGLGCEALFGVAKLESGQIGIHDEALFVANYNGLYAFQGSWAVKPLSWKIEGTWRGFSETYFNRTRVAVQPTKMIVYVLTDNIGYNAGSPASTTLYLADYSNGLNYEEVKWSSLTSNTSGLSYSHISHIQTETVLANGGDSNGLLFSVYLDEYIYRQTATKLGIDTYRTLTVSPSEYVVINATVADSAGIGDYTFNPNFYFDKAGSLFHITGFRYPIFVHNFNIGPATILVGITTYSDLVSAVSGDVVQDSFTATITDNGMVSRTKLTNLTGRRFTYSISKDTAQRLFWSIPNFSIFFNYIWEDKLL